MQYTFKTVRKGIHNIKVGEVEMTPLLLVLSLFAVIAGIYTIIGVMTVIGILVYANKKCIYRIAKSTQEELILSCIVCGRVIRVVETVE